MRHIILVGFVVLSFVSSVSAQKVKYKDLFILLNAENFKDADPFLRKFIVDNPDHPNANYQMGKMLQTYMMEADLIKDSLMINEFADSALLYLNKSLEVCTEKYVEKKHDDDYYAGHRRRNLRTGKFEVKLSDVQLEMEGRKEAIEKFKEDDSKLITHFRAAGYFNESVFELYSSLVDSAENINILYFTAGADELQILREIPKNYDSIIYHYNTYRVLKKDMSRNSPVQKFEEKPVSEYPIKGSNKVDFTAETVEVWNLKAWSKQAHDKIGKEIFPLKSRLIAYDKELDEVHDRIVRDSLDGRSEIFALATKNVGRDLRDYDPSSLPAAIFNFRIAEINYHSTTNVWHLDVHDTVNIDVKYSVLDDIGKQLSGVTKLAGILVEANNAQERLLFRDFINDRYTDENGLYNFIQEQVSFVNNDSIQLDDWISETNKLDTRTMWYTDSIPLFAGGQIQNLDSITYSTFSIDSLDDRRIGFYSWQAANDSLALAFGIAPSSRILDSLYTVDLGLLIEDQTLITSTYLSDSLNDDSLVWVIPKKKLDDNVSLKIFTTSVSSGLGWSKELIINEDLNDVKYDRENHRIMIYGDEEKLLLVLNDNGEEEEIVEVTDEIK